ncbi:Bsp6I family type II restriction endonuclease [Dehalobacter sp. TBBPA1]|uniref:Bsp6I family type II restriction endonuclease n=1 Tax=Dehalobacter sp. TBBPA1 TaxID=3235037 RepID=UPI0034A3DAE3
MGLKKISKEDFDECIDIYFEWKKLSKRIKKIYGRGLNFPELVSEYLCCYVNKFEHSTKKGSEDAVGKKGKKIQIKATSNYNSDLSSFGPKSEFDELHFVRLNLEEDKLEFYKISPRRLNKVIVKKNITFKERQKEGKRPRFSIINKLIEPLQLEPYATIDLINKKISRTMIKD